MQRINLPTDFHPRLVPSLSFQFCEFTNLEINYTRGTGSLVVIRPVVSAFPLSVARHTAPRAVSHVIRPYFQMLTAAAAVSATVTAIAANSIAMRIIRVIEAHLDTVLPESGRGRKWDREYIYIEEMHAYRISVIFFLIIDEISSNDWIPSV